MSKTIWIITILLIGIGFIYLAQNSIAGASFGFEKNANHRKSADRESVAGCIQSCEDMLAGWLEMNPDSKNYTRQGEKIEAKAEQCLAMNELAGFPYSEDEILASCGLSAPHCVEISPRDISFGSCADISWIGETNLSQCCGVEGPQGGIDCGTEGEWVVGVAAVPTCYIPGS